MNQGKTLFIAGIIVVVLAIALFLFFRNENSETMPVIKAGTLQGGISTLDVMEATSISGEHGFSLEVLRLQKTPDILAALAKGDIDVAVIPAEMVARLIEDNTSIRIIAVDMLQNQAILSMDDIGSIDDLRGKTVGALLASGTYKMFKAYVKAVYNITVVENGSPGPDEILAVNVLPGSFLDALASGDVDAVVVWEPFVSKGVVSYNAGIVSDYMSLWGKTGLDGEPVMLVWVANKDFVDKNPGLAEAFVSARDDAALYWKNNKDNIVKLLVDLYMLSEEEAEYLYERVIITMGSLDNYVDSIRNVWWLAWQGGYLMMDPSGIGEEVFLSAKD